MNQLGELRRKGRTVEQAVLNAQHCRITYMLYVNGEERQLGKMISGVGCNPLPPGISADAERVITTRRAELLALLEPAQHGPFYADSTGYVMATLVNESGAEIHAIFIDWQGEKIVVNATTPHVGYDNALAFARTEWAALPEDVRRRLVGIARPWTVQ